MNKYQEDTIRIYRLSQCREILGSIISLSLGSIAIYILSAYSLLNCIALAALSLFIFRIGKLIIDFFSIRKRVESCEIVSLQELLDKRKKDEEK